MIVKNNVYNRIYCLVRDITQSVVPHYDFIIADRAFNTSVHAIQGVLTSHLTDIWFKNSHTTFNNLEEAWRNL